jgi:GxxExxY protein
MSCAGGKDIVRLTITSEAVEIAKYFCHRSTRNYTEEKKILAIQYLIHGGIVMLKEETLSYVIRGCIYEVFKHLGCGFLEKVYRNALLGELKLQGLHAVSEMPIKVQYKNAIVGEYVADIIVEDSVIIELKAQQQLLKVHEAQLLNYLKATDLKLGMLVNFAYPRATIKRLVI